MRITRNDRRLIVIGAFLVTAILGAAGWLVLEQRTAAITETRRATANLAQVLAEQTARSLLPVDLTLREIQGRLEGAGPDIAATAGSAAIFGMLTERLKGLPEASRLAVIGADGRMLNSTRGFPPPPIDLSARDIFVYLSTHDDHALYVSRPDKNLLRRQWTIYLGRRINGPGRRCSPGIADAAFSLTALEDFYAAVTPQDGSVTLLRRDGTDAGPLSAPRTAGR